MWSCSPLQVELVSDPEDAKGLKRGLEPAAADVQYTAYGGGAHSSDPALRPLNCQAARHALGCPPLPLPPSLRCCVSDARLHRLSPAFIDPQGGTTRPAITAGWTPAASSTSSSLARRESAAPPSLKCIDN